MRFPQLLAVIVLSVFLTLLISGQSGCNPFTSSTQPNLRATHSNERRNGNSHSTRAQNDEGPIRFDSTLVTHYAPDENLERVDTDLLATAQHTLDVAAYSLTDFALRDALIAAAGRGVTIRIYLDKVQSAGEEKKEDRGDDRVLQALAATPGITVRIKHSAVLMHLNYVSSEIMWCAAVIQTPLRS